MSASRRTGESRSAASSRTFAITSELYGAVATSNRVLVRNGECLVEHRDALLDLLARDRQRWADHDHVPVRHEIETSLQGCLRDPGDGGEGLATRVEGDERLARLAVLDELDAPEAPEAAQLADGRMALLEAAQLLGKDAAHLGRVLDDAFLLEGLDRSDRRRAGQRVARVGEPAGKILVPHPLCDGLADDHCAERDVAGVDPL